MGRREKGTQVGGGGRRELAALGDQLPLNQGQGRGEGARSRVV